MAKKLQLQIPEPCHEDWDKMTPGDKGRFCDSCQKTVHDFTGMSDAQLVAFFKKPSTGSVCGRFYNDQLERELEIPRKRIPWLKYFFQFTIPIFLTSLKAQSQVNLSVKQRSFTSLITNETSIAIRGQVASSFSVSPKILGRVVDDKGNGIPFSSVYIKGTKQGTTCDSAGNFTMDMFKEEKKITLTVSCIGFSPAEKEINLKKDSYAEILLTANATVNKEVVVTAFGLVRKGYVTYGFVTCVKDTSIVSKQEPFLQKIKNLFTSKSVKLYPNPVSRSQQVSIEFENAKTEKISLRLFSLDGKLAGMKEYEAVKGTNKISYSINSQLATGSYAIQLIDGSNKIIKTDKLIVQ